MKKLLLVLVVVAMASFLLVGCLPGIVDDGDDDDDDGDVVVPAAMTFDKEYTNAGGVTFVPCGDTITVTFPTAVEVDYVVYIAERTAVDTYGTLYAATPNAGRTIWTLEDYPFAEADCAPICLVALVKHPCCPAIEEILRIVTVDCVAPKLDLFVKFTDCADECVDPDPCLPEFEGVFMEWTSRTSDPCETLDCCEDTCSGVNGWSLVIDPDPCLGPCDTVSGTGCPVEGVLECACLAYAPDTLEDVCYYVDFSFEDNVGNAVESTWKLCFDTDELVEFELGSRDDDGDYVAGSDLTAVDDWYTIYDMAGCPVF